MCRPLCIHEASESRDRAFLRAFDELPRTIGSCVVRPSSIVPSNTTPPSCSIAMRSPTLLALTMSWVTTIDVTPSRFCRLRISASMASAVIGSRPGRRLIVQDVVGIHRDRPGEARPACASRPKATTASCLSVPARSTHSSRSATMRRISDSLLQMVFPQTQPHVLTHGERVEQRRALWNSIPNRRLTTRASSLLGHADDVLAFDFDLEPASGSMRPDDVLEQHALAGATASHHDDGLPRLDVEVDPVEDLLRPQPLLQVLECLINRRTRSVRGTWRARSC